MSHTHEHVVVGDRLIKRYTSWRRGEHSREWTVLRLVHEHQPGLGPQPLQAELDGDPPAVTMSVVPGQPLSGRLTPVQLDALARALRALWTVPVDGLPPRRLYPAEALAEARRLAGTTPRPEGPVGRAHDAAVAFLDGLGTDPPLAVDVSPAVLGHSDPNLTNYLWDGARVRIVDFEDAGRSDVAYELATLVEHRSARGTEWNAFMARFDVDPERLLAARRLVAVIWLLWLLPGGPSADRNPPEAGEEQALRVLHLLA